MVITSAFKTSKWNETKLESFSEVMPIARASAEYVVEGKMSGVLKVEYVMHYTFYDTLERENTEATYVGFMLFDGSIGDKSGSFIMEDRGLYMNLFPQSKLTVKPLTGTGDFTGISGNGKYYTEDGEMLIELDIEL